MTGLHWPVSVPWKHSGDCTVRGPCISSPNYPSFYGNSQRCNISLPKPSVLRVVDFATEAEYDVLTVNGMRYSGVSGDSSSEPALAVGDVFVLWTDIVWESDYRDSNIGWELCVEPFHHASMVCPYTQHQWQIVLVMARCPLWIARLPSQVLCVWAVRIVAPGVTSTTAMTAC